MGDLDGFLSPARSLGSPARFLDEPGSTNDDAKRWASEGAPHGALVHAERQTRGRGRLGRAWRSPPGENLCLSLVLRPTLAPSAAPTVALAAGLGLAEAVERFLPVAATVKWPNDVRVGGLKVAGVLVEGALRGASLEYVVLGVGLNVRGEAPPPGLEASATTLRAVRGRDLSRAEVLGAVLLALEARLGTLFTEGLEALLPALSARCDTLGRRVTVGDETGLAESLAPDGALVLLRDDASRVAVYAGDVVPAQGS
ncbi:MAG: biotin--[acetyl-CoA-carboxylase] ligase [Deltaproteobacteria bacterium]|nr:biotin--[acetyl-CoA-carboxylase] ligase [Deltaproteobacteria bacterium]